MEKKRLLGMVEEIIDRYESGTISSIDIKVHVAHEHCIASADGMQVRMSGIVTPEKKHPAESDPAPMKRKYKKRGRPEQGTQKTIADMDTDYGFDAKEIKVMKLQLEKWERDGWMTENQIMARASWPKRISKMDIDMKRQVKEVFEDVKKAIAKETRRDKA